MKTPNIDRLAARVCVSRMPMPVRQSRAGAGRFATGQYPHQTGYWDNVFAHDGRVRGWGHRLQEEGHRFTQPASYTKDSESNTGIDEQILPMHIYGEAMSSVLSANNLLRDHRAPQ